MLTIGDALGLPVFERAKLVAGSAGLENVIRWVHIVSMPESGSYAWTKGNELILTVGLGLRENLEKQADTIPKLVEYGIAGLVLSVGHYFAETPPIMVTDANRLGFPIIELPGDIPFVEVTEAIFSQIVNAQYATMQRAQAIHNTLTDIVLNGGTLQDLTEALADLLNKSITIESAAFELLADAQKGPVDPARERSVEIGKTAPQIIDQLQRAQLENRLRRSKQPVRIEPQPELGLEMGRIVAPIVVGQHILGYMWIIAAEEQFTDLDTLAVEQAATVAALLLYKEKAVQESKRALRGDFFSQLLQADQYTTAQLESQASTFDFRLRRNYQVLVVENQDKSGNTATLLPGRVEAVLREQVHALVVLREQRVVIVLQVRQAPPGKRIARLLFDALQTAGGDLQIGVGTATSTLVGIATSYEQALEALTIARSTHQTSGVYLFGELGLLHWLLQLPETTLEDNVFYCAVRDLVAHDTNNSKQLFDTLDAFLEHGGSMKDAAESLFVHRNTLAYRLERIEELTGLDLRNSHNQMNLYVALKTYRLRRNTPPSP